MRIITRITCAALILAALLGATCQIQDYRKIPQYLEKNHHIKDKTFFLSATMVNMVVHVHSYNKADISAVTMFGESAKITIDSSNVEIKSGYEIMDKDIAQYMPALIISDINYLKKAADIEVKQDSTVYVRKGDYTIEMRKPKKIDSYLFYTDFTFRQKGQLLYINAKVDSIR